MKGPILIYSVPSRHLSSAYSAYANELVSKLSSFVEVEQASSLHEISRSSLTDYQLIHVMGCWSRSAAQLLLRADNEDVPTVFSPLGGLQPWRVKQHRMKRGLQHRMAQRASAVHVGGKLECDTFAQLGWNDKVVVVKNPLFTSDVSWEEVTQEMLSLYRRTIDSEAYRCISPQARRTLGRLLQVSIDPYLLHREEDGEKLRNRCSQISEEDWRLMVIYAQQQQVFPLLVEGLQLCGSTVKLPVIPLESGFTTVQKQLSQSLEKDKLLSRNVLLRNKVHDYIGEDEPIERAVCIQMANLKFEMERGTASLALLAEFYKMLRHQPMDEVRVVEFLEMMGLTTFSARVMAIEQRVLSLSEGFMLMDPLYDRSTTEMIKQCTQCNWPTGDEP